MRLQTVCILASLALTGCHSTEPASGGARIPPHFPLTKVTRSNGPVFEVDAAKDFCIELGRGSGMDGLETVAISSDGTVVLHRLTKPRGWVTATLVLPQDALKRILTSLKVEKVMAMADAYHAGIADGTQWVLTVAQGDRHKAIYFDNHFPQPVLRFASIIDTELRAAGESTLRWKSVPKARWGDHDAQLWGSIKNS